MNTTLKKLSRDELLAFAATALIEVLGMADADDVERFTVIDHARCERILALRDEIFERIEAQAIVLPDVDGIES